MLRVQEATYLVCRDQEHKVVRESEPLGETEFSGLLAALSLFFRSSRLETANLPWVHVSSPLASPAWNGLDWIFRSSWLGVRGRVRRLRVSTYPHDASLTPRLAYVDSSLSWQQTGTASMKIREVGEDGFLQACTSSSLCQRWFAEKSTFTLAFRLCVSTRSCLASYFRGSSKVSTYLAR